MANADDGTSNGRGLASEAGPSRDIPTPGPVNTIHRRSDLRWLVVPAALLFLMALFLAYILWPGNLVYAPRDALLDDARASELQHQHNATLEHEIRVLQGALSDGVCTASRSTDDVGLPLFAPGSSTALPAGEAPSRPIDTAAPDAAMPQGDVPDGEASAPSPGGATRLPSSTLLRRLDETTVFIAGLSGQAISTGTGVIVSDRYVLTNHHVVAGVEEGTIRIANKHLDRPLGARVVARTSGSPIGGSDFALLELEQPIPVQPLAMAGRSEPLDPVVAAGFPAFVIQSDPEFVAAFQDGELDRLNGVQMAFTEGAITNKQPGPDGVTVIGHSATISQGNSGGPLIDRCGRLVGVNTFVRTEAENALRMNFALGAADAAVFLSEHGIEAPLVATACGDAVAPASPAADPSQDRVATPDPAPATQAPALDPAAPQDGDAEVASPPAVTPDVDRDPATPPAPAPDRGAEPPPAGDAGQDATVLEPTPAVTAPPPAEDDALSRDADADLMMPPSEHAE